MPVSEGERLNGADGDGAAAEVVAELQDALQQDEGQVVALAILPLLCVEDGPRGPGGPDLQLQAELQLHLPHRPAPVTAVRGSPGGGGVFEAGF